MRRCLQGTQTREFVRCGAGVAVSALLISSWEGMCWGMLWQGWSLLMYPGWSGWTGTTACASLPPSWFTYVLSCSYIYSSGKVVEIHSDLLNVSWVLVLLRKINYVCLQPGVFLLPCITINCSFCTILVSLKWVQAHTTISMIFLGQMTFQSYFCKAHSHFYQLGIHTQYQF